MFKKLEYKVLTKLRYLNWKAYESELNKLSEEGWRVVTVSNENMILKRMVCNEERLV